MDRKIPDILGAEVKHGKFGKGKILSIVGDDNKMVNVKFADREMSFVFPTAFEQYLTILNTKKAAAIGEWLKSWVAEKNREKEEEIKRRKAEEQARRDAIYAAAKKEMKRAAVQTPRKSNIAFKQNYCDGGSDVNCIGFRGICSEELIEWHIKEKQHTWCSNESCPCMEYYTGKKTYEALCQEYEDESSPCTESDLLDTWCGDANYNINGEPRKIRGAAPQRLCVLTTMLPGEKERLIFAAFMIKEIFEGDDYESGQVYADSEYRIELTPDEAHAVRFWDYYQNESISDSKFWGSGLVRYFDDKTAVRMLKGIVEAKTTVAGKKKARELFDRYCQVNRIEQDDV